MAVPFFRLELGKSEREAVDKVLETGWLTTGKQCTAFECEFAEAIGGGVEAVAVNSNTAGMHLVLESLGIGPGDEVIVPSLTFTATAEVVRYLGADVVFVDVDRHTLNITAEQIEMAVTEKTKAVMVVHFGGLAADMRAIMAVAERFGLKVVEDAAHSFPATSQGKPIGRSGGAAAIFSFYANKTITTGEGGMIVTQDAALAKRCRTMRLHGMDRDAFERFNGKSAQWRYDVIAPGFKYNMSDIAAALGREQLKKAECNRERRQRIAETYHDELKGLPLELPIHGRNEMHAWHIYPVRIAKQSGVTRDHAEVVLAEKGIGYSVHYTPLHRMSYWRNRYNLTDEQFPNASNQGDTSFSLPLFSAMRDGEISEVVSAVHTVFDSCGAH